MLRRRHSMKAITGALGTCTCLDGGLPCGTVWHRPTILPFLLFVYLTARPFDTLTICHLVVPTFRPKNISTI